MLLPLARPTIKKETRHHTETNLQGPVDSIAATIRSVTAPSVCGHSYITCPCSCEWEGGTMSVTEAVNTGMHHYGFRDPLSYNTETWTHHVQQKPLAYLR